MGQDLERLDIVYVFHTDSGDDSELKYSLRSLENLPHRRVFIIGDRPSFEVKNLTHIPLDRISDYLIDAPYVDVNYKLSKICIDERVSDDFIFMNDDFFILSKVDRIDPIAKGSIEELVEEKWGQASPQKLYANLIMRDFGVVEGQKKNFELHVPMVFNKKNLLQVLKENPRSVIRRSLYGNRFYGDVCVEYPKDVKVYGNESIRPTTGPYVSTAYKSFNNSVVGEYIRHKFPNKSRYEV